MSLALTRRRLLAAALAAAAGQALPRHAHAQEERDPDDYYHALRTGRPERLQFAGGEIALLLDAASRPPPPERVRAWVRRSADILSVYFGRFPVAQAGLVIEGEAGARVGAGTAWGYDGPLVRIRLGREISEASLEDDWVLIHELTHLALPGLARRHSWLTEGSATYVEPVARVMAGTRPASFVWRQFASELPKGLPAAGDRGLDHTPTWGRTYWGGALFCLLADVELRRASDNRRGLRDVFVAANRASGGNAVRWNIQRLIEVAESSTGTPAFGELYQRLAHHPDTPDPQALLRELGVLATGRSVRLDDDAPLAAVRRAITTA